MRAASAAPPQCCDVKATQRRADINDTLPTYVAHRLSCLGMQCRAAAKPVGARVRSAQGDERRALRPRVRQFRNLSCTAGSSSSSTLCSESPREALDRSNHQTMKAAPCPPAERIQPARCRRRAIPCIACCVVPFQRHPSTRNQSVAQQALLMLVCPAYCG